MEKNYFKDWSLKLLILVSMGCGFLLFQGQDSNEEPVSDRWRLPNYSGDNVGYPQVQPFVVVTTPDGYDNFDMGIDNAESTIQVHPANPTWFATGWNGNPLGIAAT